MCFILWLKDSPLCEYTAIIYLLDGRHLECFRFGVVIKRAGIKILAQVFYGHTLSLFLVKYLGVECWVMGKAYVQFPGKLSK